jgi:dihydrofolate reductase
LDGFIHDRNGSLGRLYADFDALRDAPAFQEAIRNTGAVVMGRRTFEMGDRDSYAEHYEFQVPIFVLTHSAPQQHPKENDHLKFTFVSDGIESAIAQARRAAGNRDVQVVGGASTIQQALNAALVDELQIDVMPVLLGEGLRFFEHIDTERIKLEKTRVEETTPARTSVTFKVSYG